MRKVLRGWMRRFGVDLAPFPLKEYLRRYPVDLVVDVGANAGQYGRMLRTLGYRGRILSFEPCRDAFSRLEACARTDSHWDCRRLAFGDRDGPATIQTATDSVFNTLRQPLADHDPLPTGARWIGEEQIEIRTMDRYFEEQGLPDGAVVVKLDTQGFEREILEGGEQTLQRVRALQLEMSLEPLYTGQALADEMLPIIRGLGFEVFGMWPGYRDRATGRLMEADFLFVRREPRR